MPDIPNKGRILRLLQYLYLNTDEEHAATTQDLIDALAETGFKANRKTVKDDIDCQTAHCGRCKLHFDFGVIASPIVPYRNLPQAFSVITADCRSLV